MIVGIKDTVKLIGVAIISCCAVFICAIFLNYYFDVELIQGEITSDLAMFFYNAQVSTAKVVCIITGGCLFITSMIMLLFYIKHYVDTHKKELGILKALGYSNFKIAKNFWIFGLSVFLGTALGFGGAFLIMPKFYELQNADKILPDVMLHFNPSVLIIFVLLPTVVFSVLAICYAIFRLKRSALSLLRDCLQTSNKIKKQKNKTNSERTFLSELKINTLKSKKSLIFFIIFAAFCFSGVVQMAFSMKDLSSEMMGVMMTVIGVVLSVSILFLAIITVVKGNTKTIAMMRVYGYTQKECSRSILGVYRPLSYLGFALGTVYQYCLLRIMVDVVFKNVEGVPAYKFDFLAMGIVLLVFVIIYEVLMYVYSEKIKRISVKEIMLE